MGAYTLNVPQVDYLTVTTRSYPLYLQYKDLCRGLALKKGLPTTPFTVLDYSGMVSPCGTISCGSRTVDGVGEYIVQLSGADTERVYRSVATDEKFNTTRVDIAYMSSATSYPKPEELLPMLSANGVLCEVRSDERSHQTLYIGKRDRTRYVRIYEKDIGERTYIRFEVEIKKRLATRLAVPAMNDMAVRYAVLAGSIEKLPLLVQSQLAMDFGSSRCELPKEEVRESCPETYRDWFRDVVVPSLLKRMRGAEQMRLGSTEYALEYRDLLAMLQVELEFYINDVKGVEERLGIGYDNVNASGKRRGFKYGSSGQKRPIAPVELECGYSDDDVWKGIPGYD